jgi:hypothetical protein
VDSAKEEICRKLRKTNTEFGYEVLIKAVVISSNDYTQVGGLDHIIAYTVSNPTLGNVSFNVARFFENI